MTSLIWNFVEVNLIVILLSSIFILMKGRISFTQQRAFLIGIPILSVLIVFFKSSLEVSNYTIPLVELAPVNIGGLTEVGKVSSVFTLHNLYWVGVIFVSLTVLFKLFRLGYFFFKNPSKKQDSFKVYRVIGRESFSFFNRIQIEPELSIEQERIVFEHEKIHVQKRHSLDLLFMEVFKIVFWFNPTFVLLKRELINIHEFEVDQKMYQKHQVKYMEFLINHAFQINTTPFSLSHQFFNHLTLKQRIINMKKKHQKKTWLLGVLPIVAILATVTQCTKPEITEVETRMEETVYDEVDEYPSFKGGDVAMTNFISENIVYPIEASENGIQGIVYVNLVVSSTGKVKDCKLRKGVDPLLDAEAVRTISLMPDWNPGKHKGKNVAVEYTIPIQFRLNE